MPQAQPAGGQLPATTDVTARRSLVVSIGAAALVVLAVLLAAASVPLYALLIWPDLIAAEGLAEVGRHDRRLPIAPGYLLEPASPGMTRRAPGRP
jgi:hypothetical protein